MAKLKVRTAQWVQKWLQPRSRCFTFHKHETRIPVGLNMWSDFICLFISVFFLSKHVIDNTRLQKLSKHVKYIVDITKLELELDYGYNTKYWLFVLLVAVHGKRYCDGTGSARVHYSNGEKWGKLDPSECWILAAFKLTLLLGRSFNL